MQVSEPAGSPEGGFADGDAHDSLTPKSADIGKGKRSVQSETF
jgi:hypothetical protein